MSQHVSRAVDPVARGRRTGRATAGFAVIAALALLGAYSNGGGAAAAVGKDTTHHHPPTSVARPAGPAADVSQELTGGKGVFIGAATPDDMDEVGYVQHEYVAAGTATSYKSAGAPTNDGKWSYAPDQSASYRTRIIVRTPKRPWKFSGRVVVEWLNVSGGVDAEPEWSNLQEEITRSGDAYVGVSAQLIGVEGGPVAVPVNAIPGAEQVGMGLKKIDPARYGSLVHPGDGYSFDIYTQVARALRAGHALRGLKPRQIIAAGQSQSAFAMVTYYDGVQPLTKAFDGFFVHSRGGASLPLVGPGKPVGIADSLGGTPVQFRDDLTAPVMDLQTEGDLTSLLGSYRARQDDSSTFRLWEVAGTAHADVHTLGSAAQFIDCGVPINDGALHIVAKASYKALKGWMVSGRPPRSAPRLEVSVASGTPTIERDSDGIALGGIRTPPVDVPVAALSGQPGPAASVICLLLGSTTPFTAARIAQLYPSRHDYLRQYRQATHATIKAGYALQGDREALLGFARPAQVPA